MSFLKAFSLFFPPVPPDVIDVSSGEDDAEIHVSSPSPNGEEESEPSGAHANDALNGPDPQGRVLVNLNHPGAEEDIFLSPQLARAVKPHQVVFTFPRLSLMLIL